MSASDAIRLLLLSAIWGASFLFMRIAVPEFGPFALAASRVAGAALVLLPFLLRPPNRYLLRTRPFSLLLLGFLSSALPFTCFCWAALSLEAGFTSLLNATTPIFTAIVGFLWLRLPLTRPQVLGLVVGFAGIAILAGNQLSFKAGGSGWAILAVLLATTCYGFGGHFAKRRFGDDPPLAVSAGSLLGSAVLFLPVGLFTLPDSLPGAGALASAAGLAFLCTAVAYVMFFDLLSRRGATAASTVTFIIPIFGILWGVLFLSETVSGRILLGMAVALLGTALVTRVLPARRKPAI